MKILAAGDLHGDVSISYKLAEVAEKNDVDLVLLCGDVLDSDQESKGVVSPLVKDGRELLLIPGNHEIPGTTEFLSDFYNAHNLHDNHFIKDDVAFFGFGGGNIGLWQYSEEEIYKSLIENHKKVKDVRKRVMVTHLHPSNTKMEKFSSFVPGSSGVEKAMRSSNPPLLLCSHVHEAEGIEEKVNQTKVINVGKRGKIIEI